MILQLTCEHHIIVMTVTRRSKLLRRFDLLIWESWKARPSSAVNRVYCERVSSANIIISSRIGIASLRPRPIIFHGNYRAQQSAPTVIVSVKSFGRRLIRVTSTLCRR